MASFDRQQGVALVLLLVMLAALTLLVTGVTGRARVDTRLTQVMVQRAQAASLTRGYAHVVLRDLARAAATGRAVGAVPFRRSYRDGDVSIEAQVYPAAALVDPTAAQPELLVQLLRYVGGLSSPAAQDLAEAVVGFRDSPVAVATGAEPGSEVGGRRFVVLEDLLRVPGLNRDVYEKMAPVLRIGGSALPAPLLAQDRLLPVLAEGDGAQVAAWRRQRGADDSSNGSGAVAWKGLDYELVMSTTFSDGSRYTRRISVQPSYGGGQPPWTFRRVFPVTAEPARRA